MSEKRVTKAAVPTIVLAVAVAVVGYLLVTQTGGSDTELGSAGAETDAATDAVEPAGSVAEADEPAQEQDVPELSTEERDEIIAELATLARREPDDPLAIGDDDAPVVLIEYADYQCGYCAQFAQETMPELIDSYVDDGTLRVEWRDLPIFGEESERAAAAGRAAGQQGAFWPFHDLVFSDEYQNSEGAFTEESLTELAMDAGVEDIDRFGEDMESEDLSLGIQTDRAEAGQLGMTSTPAFLVNGQPVMGAQPLEVFETLIEDALASATQ